MLQNSSAFDKFFSVLPAEKCPSGEEERGREMLKESARENRVEEWEWMSETMSFRLNIKRYNK